MSAKDTLIAIAKLGSEICGEPIPLGFDVERIAATTLQMPNGFSEPLKSLFTEAWPSDYILGVVDFLGPDRINAEHSELYPGISVIHFGFICFGSDGAGTLYTYSTDDSRVYLLPNEYFTDDGLHSFKWAKLETNSENIKSIAVESWDSIDVFLEWALAELRKYRAEGDLKSN